MRLVARTRDDLFDAPGVVANDLRLGGFEVDRATLAALLQQRLVHVGQVQQVLHAVFALGRFRATRVDQNRCDFGVREARMTEHHGRVELVRVDLTVGCNQHVAHHAQALDFGVERAQAVAQLLRQHRNDTARKIDAGGAVVRVDVDARAGLHVRAHIGNGNEQSPALATSDLGRLAVHGIVEVARVFAVDGDERHVGQVDAPLLVGGAHRVGQCPGFRQTRLRELMRHTVLAHRDFDLHSGIVDLAQYLFDATDRLTEQCRRLGKLHHHDLADLGGAGSAFRDQHVLPVALVFGGDKPDAALMQQPADDGLLGTLDDLYDTAFRPAATVLSHHARLDAVFVQYRTHLIGRQVNVGFTIVALYEAVPIAMSLNRAFDLIQQAAGMAVIFDTISLFPEIQNTLHLCSMWAQVAELVDALVSGTSE